MRVAVAHEWLIRHAGSERCVEQMLATFPGARLLTTLVRPEALPPDLRDAEPSFLQHLPGSTRYHEWLVPLMPLAWRTRKPVRDVDLLISSSHACAKGVRADPGIPHLCYCHTPMRYAWDFDAEASRFPAPVRPVARIGMAWFRRWDRKSSERVDRFLANSTAVAGRIETSYGRSATILHPPVDTDYFTPDGERDGHFLYVGRLTGYKQPELVVRAFEGLPYSLKVVGSGPLEQKLRAQASDNVSFLGQVGPTELRDLYRSARALVFPVEEDFGVAMAEAQACGTPVIALNRGGAVDIVEDGVTGWLLDEATKETVRRAVLRAAREELDEDRMRRSAERFSAERFRAGLSAAADELVAGRRDRR